MVVNPLHAKFFTRNKNWYLHFMSHLLIDMAQVVKIIIQVRQEITYSTYSISWVLMSWRRKELGDQQPWYYYVQPGSLGARTLRAELKLF